MESKQANKQTNKKSTSKTIINLIQNTLMGYPAIFTHQCSKQPNLRELTNNPIKSVRSFTLSSATKMENFLFLVFAIPIIATEAVVIVGGGVGIGVGGGGGGGVWIGGGVNLPANPSASNLNRAYVGLQAWKSAITDDPRGILRSWIGPNVCSYGGVYCSDTQDFLGNPVGKIVSAIDLNRADLQGSLVNELSLLSDLSILHLNSNRFGGGVPLSIRDLSSLTELDLSNNHFSGAFPVPLLYIPNLVYLDLRFNGFSGPIPEDLFNKKLDAIFLNNNLFDGELPQNLGSSPASVINLANNRFTGAIPLSMGGYMGGGGGGGIREILFLNNQLTGCIPEGIGMWTNLQVLDLSSNALMGHLPDSLSCLRGIEVLNLANNKLSGELPNLVCTLRSLLNLTVAANFFSGFSQDCDRLLFRNVFDIAFNCIPGRLLQRPEPDCSAVPGSGAGLSCLRIPSTRSPFACGTLFTTNTATSSSTP